jgi:hypothetical protein
MSVVLEAKMAAGRTVESALGPYTDEFVVSLTADLVRSHEQGVVHTPSTHPYDEPAHGDVVGEKKKPASRKKRFLEASAWEIEPPDDFEPPTELKV